ncbi:hypothetical protein E6O75_ATG03356 [Venturia nashicola]|uniref:Uncharacterized protein n=1 Tax=Venturia nashicola TaxID=86259 RepID=A0A4Z1PK22_9PEZI|nr:hypothetical protein E6O75_ATG03356 [Venturia nashicola]
MFISSALLALLFYIAMSCLAKKLDLDWSSRVEQTDPDMEDWANDGPDYSEQNNRNKRLGTVHATVRDEPVGQPPISPLPVPLVLSITITNHHQAPSRSPEYPTREGEGEFPSLHHHFHPLPRLASFLPRFDKAKRRD